jgi:PKD repeat protein
MAPLAVQFTDSSTGSPTSWSWDFGDGGTSNAQNPSHTYASAGVYDVTLTATNASGSDAEVKTDYITVSEPPTGGITLNVRLYKLKGTRNADLTWDGATSTNVDVWRNGVKTTTATANDGFFTDVIPGKGGGSFTYKICEAGTSTCSAEVSASF